MGVDKTGTKVQSNYVPGERSKVETCVNEGSSNICSKKAKRRIVVNARICCYE